MKNAVIVNLSDIFEYRVDMIYSYLSKKGWSVKVLASDFMHIEKRKRKENKKDYLFIDTKPYYKNISLIRLYSHYNFARKTKYILRDMCFDLLYIVAPANSLIKLAKLYFKDAKIRIIIDIIDLWPESLPIKGTERFPLSIWGNVRNHNLKYADYIITECDLYQKKLKKWLLDKKVRTVYWCHKKENMVYEESTVLGDELTLCYLGSINNIIDITGIVQQVRKLIRKQSVVIKIIGGGEKEEEFIKSLEEVGAKVINYGKIYDFAKKKAVADTCHFGINIMKQDVSIGLSMKSVDYFEMGLPIINNLDGDLKKIIEQYNCGINISRNKCDTKEILYKSEMRKNARLVYKLLFSVNSFENALEEIIREIGFSHF